MHYDVSCCCVLSPKVHFIELAKANTNAFGGKTNILDRMVSFRDPWDHKEGFGRLSQPWRARARPLFLQTTMATVV